MLWAAKNIRFHFLLSYSSNCVYYFPWQHESMRRIMYVFFTYSSSGFWNVITRSNYQGIRASFLILLNVLLSLTHSIFWVTLRNSSFSLNKPSRLPVHAYNFLMEVYQAVSCLLRISPSTRCDRSDGVCLRESCKGKAHKQTPLGNQWMQEGLTH